MAVSLKERFVTYFVLDGIEIVFGVPLYVLAVLAAREYPDYYWEILAGFMWVTVRMAIATNTAKLEGE